MNLTINDLPPQLESLEYAAEDLLEIDVVSGEFPHLLFPSNTIKSLVDFSNEKRIIIPGKVKQVSKFTKCTLATSIKDFTFFPEDLSHYFHNLDILDLDRKILVGNMVILDTPSGRTLSEIMKVGRRKDVVRFTPLLHLAYERREYADVVNSIRSIAIDAHVILS